MNALLGRPLFLWTIFFLGGQALGFYLWPHTFFAFSLFFLSFLLIYFLIRKFRLSWLFLLLSFALPLGFVMTSIASHELEPQGIEGNATLVGEVETQPEIEEGRVTFFLKQRAQDCGQGFKARGGRIWVQLWQSLPPELGDIVRIEGKMKPAEDPFSLYLRQKGCFWTFSGKDFSKIGTSLTPLGEAWKMWRDRLADGVAQASGKVLAGIIFGRTAGMSAEETKPYRETGTAHILAASGINVALLVAFLFTAGRLLRFPRLLTLFLSIPLILLYAALCGWLPSITRASLMALTGILASLSRRQQDLLTTISLAGLIISMWDPLALFSLDFQLSFLATACLFAFLPETKNSVSRRVSSWIKTALFTTIVAQIGVLPLIASSFHLLPLISPLANLLILPLISLLLPAGLVAIGLFLLLPQVGNFLFSFLANGTWLLNQIARGLAQIPLSHWVIPHPPLWLESIYWGVLLFSLLVLLIYRMPQWRKWAIWSLILLCVIFISWVGLFPSLFPPAQLEAYFINVGQGDAILFRTPEGADILVDGGTSSACKSYLEDLGIQKLDILLLSHPHSDHLRGLFSVLEQFPVRLALVAEGVQTEEFKRFEAKLNEKKVQLLRMKDGSRLQCGALEFEFLSPPSPLPEDWSINNSSLVACIRFGGTGFFLPGDIENEARKYILHNHHNITSTVLKVPHHGSSTSLDEFFLQAISPSLAIISVGKDNAYGHPSTWTLELLQSHRVSTLLTSQAGTILLQSDGQILTIETANENN